MVLPQFWFSEEYEDSTYIKDMEHEIKRVKELTGAAEKQIELHDSGYWSRAYVVNGGEFVVKFPKYDSVNYENEAMFLTTINTVALPVNVQKLKWLAEDNRCIAMYGVRGTQLSKLENITFEQKQNIGKQIGIFLKLLHSLKTDCSGQNLDEELLEYQKCYNDCVDFFAKHFSKEEREILDYLMYAYLPAARKNLGEKLVFSHADIWEPNILLDDNGKVGIIDCSNAGHFDEAADFCVEDETLRSFILDYYGADEVLRKKVEIKYDMSTIICPEFGVPLCGEYIIIDKWIPLIRKVILKHKNQYTPSGNNSDIIHTENIG
jgi:aminoglycoside phosphotransferase